MGYEFFSKYESLHLCLSLGKFEIAIYPALLLRPLACFCLQKCWQCSVLGLCRVPGLESQAQTRSSLSRWVQAEDDWSSTLQTICHPAWWKSHVGARTVDSQVAGDYFSYAAAWKPQSVHRLVVPASTSSNRYIHGNYNKSFKNHISNSKSNGNKNVSWHPVFILNFF